MVRPVWSVVGAQMKQSHLSFFCLDPAVKCGRMLWGYISSASLSNTAGQFLKKSFCMSASRDFQLMAKPDLKWKSMLNVWIIGYQSGSSVFIDFSSSEWLSSIRVYIFWKENFSAKFCKSNEMLLAKFA